MSSKFPDADICTTNGGNIARTLFAITPFLVTPIWMKRFQKYDSSVSTFKQVRLLCKAVEAACCHKDVAQHLTIRSFSAFDSFSEAQKPFEESKKSLMKKLEIYQLEDEKDAQLFDDLSKVVGLTVCSAELDINQFPNLLYLSIGRTTVLTSHPPNKLKYLQLISSQTTPS